MDPSFWRERWKNKEIGFHQPEFDRALQKYWPRLELRPGARVFVPLCGKSLDMVWLAQQGHHVVGAELSEQAVDEFFAERGLVPDVRTAGSFTIKSSGPYELWVGNFFDLSNAAVADVEGVYDRAALIALPADMQRRYAEKMKALLPAQARILLITLDYDQRQMSGPPFSTPKQTVLDLFADRYECAQVVARDVLEDHPHFKQRGLTALEGDAFVLQPN
jgi:thiopurine S-methyltransferase